MLATAIVLRGSPALAAEQQKLAVLEFEVQKGLTIDRRTFSSRLQNAARKAAPSFLVMTQGNIETLVKAAGRTLAECEGQCAVDTGKLVGADIVIAGRISKVGRIFAISMQMYDTATGALLAGEDPEARDEEELLKVSTEAAERLLAPLAGRGLPSAPVAGAGAAKEGRFEELAKPMEAGGAEEVLVAFDTEPTGSVVQLDGRLLCQATPCKRLLAPGPHEVSMQKEGYEDITQALTAKKGLVVSQRLSRISAFLDVETEPTGLKVNIDGESGGASPVRRRELPAGTHEVAISDPCWLRSGERVTLKKGEDRTLRLSGKPRVARLTVTAEDQKGNAAEGTAKADGQELGAVPGTFTVWICLKVLSVEAVGLGAQQVLRLVEGKATTMRMTLASLGPRPGKTGVEPNSGVELVALPGGDGKGGQIVSPFSLARTATTVAQYERCVDTAVCTVPHNGSACNWRTVRVNHPINCVDWQQAATFCKWMGAKLPTAEQREWAASSGLGHTYPWGNEEPRPQRVCTPAGYDEVTCPVGSHPLGVSKQGLQDLAGNVKEWLANDYQGGKENRGGSMRASERSGNDPKYGIDNLGFRCGM